MLLPDFVVIKLTSELGMSLGKLKQISTRDTELKLISPFATNFNAIAVSKQGLVQYYILYSTDSTDQSGEFKPTDQDLITHLMTNNYNYQTAVGIKVGTPIQVNINQMQRSPQLKFLAQKMIETKFIT